MFEIVKNSSGGNWHTGYDIVNTGGYGTVRITGMETGCGLMQLSGFYMVITYCKRENAVEELVKAVDEVKLKLLSSGVGALVATLGEVREESRITRFLSECGFEEVYEFINYRHSDTYKQKVFICKLKK